MSDGPGFVRKPHTVLFREMVERDLYGTASPADRETLRQPENLLRWYRVLVRIEHEVDGAIARERATLTALRPASGAQPTPEYLNLKRSLAPAQARRVNFVKHLKSRASEVREMLGTQPVPSQSLGDVIGALVRVQELLAHDDVGAAERLVYGILGRLREDAACNEDEEQGRAT